jgi:hypothetical protein
MSASVLLNMFVIAGGGVEKRLVMEREMESSITDVLVKRFPLWHTTQTHSFKKL